jgi:hypothetical protein
MTRRALADRVSPARLTRPSAPPRRSVDRISHVKLQRARIQQIYGDGGPASSTYVPSPPRRQRSHFDYSGPTAARVSMAVAADLYMDSLT